ncbi:ATP-dependent DNA helicase PIF1-like [Heracleum sosnowskyi]|uniref:ATP-dependent DNA helicase PIF1-like n=1 Tax=Heracleum sosnowskyi TaxID=360622 RepID=A0AAD8HH42_9APIA|nr:ATP-dependent DNA helicase PIF1-like [Heracleum sosnowskyi]
MKWINVRDGQTVHAEIVEGLMKMLDEKNELVKEFRTQRDRFKDGEVTDLEVTETKLPFKLLRKQMPLQICYVMTINKSQGQSLENVGLFLPKPVFSHGQLYVAVSRVTSPEGLKFFIESEMGLPTNITQNVVYKEVFQNLPSN